MPRKAPKDVVEHRITLGDYERKQLVEAIDAYQKDKVLENVPNFMIGVAGLGFAAACGLVGYALYYWLDSVPSIKDIIDEATGIIEKPGNKVSEAVEGLANNVLLGMTHAEIYAKKAESDAELETMISKITERANLMLKSDYPMQRAMGQRLLDAIPKIRQNHKEKWENTLTRWNQVHLDNNPDHLG